MTTIACGISRAASQAALNMDAVWRQSLNDYKSILLGSSDAY